jgi:hypothetical protein
MVVCSWRGSARACSGSKRREGSVGLLWTKRFGGPQYRCGTVIPPQKSRCAASHWPRRVVETAAASSSGFLARAHGSTGGPLSWSKLRGRYLARRGSRRDCQPPPEVAYFCWLLFACAVLECSSADCDCCLSSRNLANTSCIASQTRRSG